MAKANGNGARLGFENKLWEMADKMRGHMDAALYEQFAQARRLEATIRKNLEALGYGGAGEGEQP